MASSSIEIWRSYYDQLKQRTQELGNVRVYFDIDEKQNCKIVILGQVNLIETYLLSILGPARIYKHDLWEHEQLTGTTLSSLLLSMKEQSRIVAGESSVERMLQRRKLSLLIIASDIDRDYQDVLSRIIDNSVRDVPVVLSTLTREELGKHVGIHRASIIGILQASSKLQLK
jgi:ribosomal protein L7Ae-like RNA K-turn-binding protein